MKSFSIITPIHAWNEQKAKELERNIESIKNLEYNHSLIEHIIINDGSTVPLTIPNYSWIKVIDQPNMQRVTAYNNGLKAAQNDIIWPLDADDVLIKSALTYIDQEYKANPKYEMFNFGCTYVHKDGHVTTRDAFTLEEAKTGHEIFGGGNIVNGTFVFSRKIYLDMGAFPENSISKVDCHPINYPAGGSQWIRDLTMSSPYDFSAWFQLTYPETKQFFMVEVDDDPHKVIKELGNPWGQDYALFYKYTRKYHSKSLPVHLEVVYIR